MLADRRTTVFINMSNHVVVRQSSKVVEPLAVQVDQIRHSIPERTQSVSFDA